MSQLQSTNIEYCRCCRSYLEELLQRKDHQAGVRYFESIKKELSEIPDDLHGAIFCMAAKAYALSGKPKIALPLIRSAVSTLSRTVEHLSDLAAAHLILGDTLRELGEYKEAVRAFRDAESIYRRSDDYSGSVDALNRLAGIFFRESDFDSAIKSLLEAIEFARKIDDRKKLAFLFGNIGRIYTLLGKLNSAEEYILMNIELSREFENETDLARARLSLGYVYTQQARYHRAEEALESALNLIRREGLDRDEIIYLTYAGELAVRTGQLEAAFTLLHDAAERGRKASPGSLLAARPLRWLAELMVMRENHRKALIYINQAMPLMKKLDNQVEIGALTKLRALCMEQIGKADDARSLYREARGIFEKCRVRVELADCMSAMSRSKLFEPAQRTMYHCRADEIYRICRVDRKPEKTELEQTAVIGNASEHENDLHDTDNSRKIELTTHNPQMEKILRQLNLLRTTDIPILFTGETGTGKDFLARYFHSIARPGRPYIAVNCAAIPDSLIEAELFGHNKGAFTGADKNRRGLFEAANGGVILLDEIGELPMPLQAKLLQVLETRKLRPLGTAREINLDIIVLAATNRNLEHMVREGSFRQDLYYRLAGIIMELPPLRKRKEDIPLLLDKFMRRYGLLNNGTGPDPELVRLFISYEWPGNIRQLDNKVKQLEAMTRLSADDKLAVVAEHLFENKTEEPGQSLYEQVEKLEKKLLTEALVSAGGNKSEAARMLSIHESTFRAKMKRYSLEGAV